MSDKIRVLLITGIVTSEHDPKVNPMIRFLLESTDHFSVKITEEFRGCTSETLDAYDLLFINYDGKKDVQSPFVGWGKTAERAVYDFVSRGGGAVIYHSSCINPQLRALPDEYLNLVGFDYNLEGGTRGSSKTALEIKTKVGAHPIVDGCAKKWITAQDDFFVNMKQIDPNVTVLATVYDAAEDYDPDLTPKHRLKELEGLDVSSLPGINQDVPVIWVHNYGKGRVMGVSIGHGPDTIRRSVYAGILVRGCEWCATGKVTIPYPDMGGWNRINAWPYYNNITWQKMADLQSF